LNTRLSTGQQITEISPPGRRSVIFVFISAFFFWTSIYFYTPVLPVYAESLGASLTTVGIIGAAYALPQLLLRIPIGMWSDSLGRRKPLVIGGMITALLGALGLWASPGPWSLILSRGLVGVGSAAWVAFTIYAVSFYSQDNTAQVVGILNFIFSAAATASTVFGGLVADARGEKYAFLIAGMLAIAALVFVLFTREQQMPKTPGFSRERLRQVTHRPLLIMVSVMGILVFFAEFSSVWGFVPVYAARIGASDTQLGILTMLASVGAMFGSLGVATLIKYRGNVFTLVLGSIVLSLSLLSVPFIHNVSLLYSTQIINGLGWGMLPTQLAALSIYHTAPRQRATAMGFFQAMYAVGMLTGPLFSGLLADYFGLSIIFYFSAAVCLPVLVMAFSRVIPAR
jgi:MFS family permease